jgi:anti-sigma B factor antagonist
MMSASVDVANNNGSAECCGTEALRIVIGRPLPGVRVVQVAGELDMVTAPHLDSCLLDQIDKRDGHVVVDLSAVTFLGAAGLTSLVKAREAAACHDIRLHLAGVDHRTVARFLEITQLRPTFAVHPSIGSAVTALMATAADRSRR